MAGSGPTQMLAATHLNAPVGPVVTVEHLVQALCAGSVEGLDERAAAVVSYLFAVVERDRVRFRPALS
jgi:hypothetical protein